MVIWVGAVLPLLCDCDVCVKEDVVVDLFVGSCVSSIGAWVPTAYLEGVNGCVAWLFLGFGVPVCCGCFAVLLVECWF